MKAIRFIKWWWKTNDGFNRSVAIILLFGLFPTIIFIPLLGDATIYILVSIMALVAVYWALTGLHWWISHLWKDFEEANPTENVAIVNKLKGRKTVEKDYFEGF